MARKAERAFALGSDLVEFRIDHLRRPDAGEVLRELSPYSGRCVLTVRPKSQGGAFRGGEEERLGLLAKISEMRPEFVDIEGEAARESSEVLERVRKRARRLIVSWHDFGETPSPSTLRKQYDRLRQVGGTAKIVTLAKTAEDNIRVLSLYERGGAADLIAFCMGEKGMFSRILSLYVGSPLAYASLPGESVAPGQLSIVQLKELIRLVG